MLSRGEAARIIALQRRKTRERERLFVAEGVRVIEELLATPIVLRYVVAAPSLEDSARGRSVLADAQGRTTVHQVSEPELERLAGTDAPQGVIALAEMPAARRLSDLDAAGDALVLVLDGVQDPGNLGTLVRAADAFAVRGVIALPGTVDCWNPKVVRSAAGSLFRTPVVRASADAAADWLRAGGFRIYAAEADGMPVDAVARAPRRALVVGNEGAGLSPEARALSDVSVAVPMPGNAESLNVAVAAGILLYALTRENA